MAKKSGINVSKLIITGLLWSIVYFGAVIPAIGWLLDFNFLSGAEWQQRYRLFVEYRWKINTLNDTILLFLMGFWIPIWGFGWWGVYRYNWNKFKPKPRKKKITKKVFELNENRPLYHMPRKMPSAVQAKRYVAPKLPNQAEEVVSGAKSHTNLVQMIRLIATLAKKFKVEIFQHILLEGNRVPMAVSTDSRAVLIEIVNKKNVTWSVEFSDDVTQGSWYSEGGVMDKLAQDLVRASASLAKSEPNSEILSAIVITDGRIVNTKQAVEYFKSKGIFLLGFNNAEPKAELPDLASFFSAYFDLKEGETDPAPHPVEKIPIRQKIPEVTEVTTDIIIDNPLDEDEIDEDEEDKITEVSGLDENNTTNDIPETNLSESETVINKSEQQVETSIEISQHSNVAATDVEVSPMNETATRRKIRAPMPARTATPNKPTA